MFNLTLDYSAVRIIHAAFLGSTAGIELEQKLCLCNLKVI